MAVSKIKTCCIIDDDPIFIYGTRRIMKEVNFCDEFIVFNDGQDALDGLSKIVDLGKKVPQVMFLDLNMPVMNGWEFLDEVLQLHSNIFENTSVYITSSSLDPRDLEKVKNYKVVSNYILKPITPNDLENVLNSLKN